MAIAGRFLQIALVLLRHACAHYGRAAMERVPWLKKRLQPVALSKPERLRVVLGSLGGSFVKLGQMLALQPDLLPFEYCRELYSLLDRVQPVPSDEIEAVFREDIGKFPAEVFEHFDRQPIASGSIGQVHVATLGGRKVAVKIQRPDTQASFVRDVKIMRAAAWLIERLHLSFLSWMIDPLSEFAAWTMEELDCRREARSQNQLRRNAAGNSRERVPAVAMKYTTRRVLVMEFLEGTTLLDHIRLLESNDLPYRTHLEEVRFDGDTYARAIIDNFLGDALRHGMFHADLHPANLMILPNHAVGYIDFGITGVISRYSREKLVALTLAYARRDLDALCARFFDVSSLDDKSDPEGFRAGIKRLSDKWYKGDEGNPALATTTTMVMLDMLKLSRATRIWPQRDVIKYIRSAIAIDGLIRQFAPHFDVGHHLAVACRRCLSWHARQALCSHDALINWSNATADLVQHGAFRLSSLLESAGEASGSTAAKSRRQENISHRTTAWQLAAVAAVVAVLAFTTNESLQLGVNLFTAQVLVAGVALATLWRVSRQSKSAHV
jgi:ubiquinone biosynthesis protein